MSDNIDVPTEAAEMTPPGSGAIAVIAVRGPNAWAILRQRFMPRLPDAVPEPGTIRFGRFGNAAMADEVVLAVCPEWIEIQTHGGAAVVQWMLELLEQQGARLCKWPQLLSWTETRWRVTAAEQLARARTERTAAILLDQYNGAFEYSLAEIRRLIGAGAMNEARARIAEMLRFESLGRRLAESWRVVIAGPPNVGKSSLMNALAGFSRSIVAPFPGTTRDIVTASMAIDGWPVELIDTAGLHEAAAGVERAGMALARSTVENADLCLWLFDASAAPVGPDARIAAGDPLLVINKCDLTPAWDLSSVPGAICISARTGAGIHALAQRIGERLVPAAPAAGAAVPFHPSCIDLLRRLIELGDLGQTDGALALLESERQTLHNRNDRNHCHTRRVLSQNRAGES